MLGLVPVQFPRDVAAHELVRFVVAEDAGEGGVSEQDLSDRVGLVHSHRCEVNDVAVLLPRARER